MDVTGDGRLVQLVRSLGFAQATADDDLLEFGLTSLQILQLSSDIEREYGVPVDLAALLDAPTLGALDQQLTTARPAGT